MYLVLKLVKQGQKLLTTIRNESSTEISPTGAITTISGNVQKVNLNANTGI